MIEIIPSLLVDSKAEFERKLRLVEHDCETIHVDILDGTLFPNTTWFDASAVGAMATQLLLRMPKVAMRPRSASQSSVVERSTST